MSNFLTMKYHYKASSKEKQLLKLLCRISKNIYNSALYELRKQYFKKKNICTYFELNQIMKYVNSKIRVTKKAHIIVTNNGNYYIS